MYHKIGYHILVWELRWGVDKLVREKDFSQIVWLWAEWLYGCPRNNDLCWITTSQKHRTTHLRVHRLQKKYSGLQPKQGHCSLMLKISNSHWKFCPMNSPPLWFRHRTGRGYQQSHFWVNLSRMCLAVLLSTRISASQCIEFNWLTIDFDLPWPNQVDGNFFPGCNLHLLFG